MTDLLIRIKKKTDGTAALSCVRADGSVTWQRQDGALGRFFPLHDLTHYAVETVLAHRNGFYGLVASGWDLTDFGTPWPRGRLPADAEWSEVLAGFLDGERATGGRWSAADFSDQAAAYSRQHGAVAPPPVSENDLDRVRARRAELFGLWHALSPGETLELTFDQPPVPAGD